MEFEKTAQRRLKGIMYDVGQLLKKKKEPKFMTSDVLTAFKEKRSTPEFLKRSKIASENKRRASEGGKVLPTHHGGSCSNIERVRRMVSFYESP